MALHAGLDVAAPYQEQLVCDPVARPGVLAFARLMTSRHGMGATALMGRAWGGGPSEHDGRAWDRMLGVDNTSQEVVARSVLAWPTAPHTHGVRGAMARRLGIMHIILNRKRWRSSAPERGRAPYDGSLPHDGDQTGARARGWKSVAAANPILGFGMTSAPVKTLQTKLGALPTTGCYVTLTKAGVTAYQQFVGPPQTGIADSRTQQTPCAHGWSAATGRSTAVTTVASTSSRPVSSGVARVDVATSYTPYKSLTLASGSRGAAVRVVQRALGGLAVDGVFGSVTRDKVVALQRSLALPRTGVVTAGLWDVLEAREFPFVADRATVLRAGDTGPQVVAVQRLLGVPPTGVFDLATREAVKVAQARAGLASTGVVASRTWSLFDRLSV